MDEVGRGAVAGPVAVGIAVVDVSTRTAPQGLRDSKLLTPAARHTISPKLRDWSVESAVGYSSAAEIDELGIMAALRLAGLRALSQVGSVDHVILDGNYNWLAPDRIVMEPTPEPDCAASSRLTPSTLTPVAPTPTPVTTVVGGDRTCSSVAAASVIAKVERDIRMAHLGAVFPEYGWDLNKGYSTPLHMRAIRGHGSCSQHRRSWNLPAPADRSSS